MDDDGGVADNVGLRLADAKVGEARTRSWRLDVYENSAKKLFEILFASIDETLDHLKPENRKLVEMTAMRRRSLQGTCPLARQALPRGGSRSEDNRRLEFATQLAMS